MVAQTDTTPASGQRILGAAERMAPVIAARAGEIEAERRLPPDLLADLTAAGCFTMLLPQSHGGAGVDLATSMRVYEALSRADASVAWTVAIAAGCWLGERSQALRTIKQGARLVVFSNDGLMLQKAMAAEFQALRKG